MNATNEKAKAFFDKPELYLSNNLNIRLRAMIVKQFLGEFGNRRILDLGCGDGSLSAQFLPAGNRLTMLDLSTNMLERARRNTPAEYADQVEYVNSDIAAFYPAEPYDAVFCIGVLAHVSSLEETIAKVATFVKPGGRCIFQISDSGQLTTRINCWLNSARQFVRRSRLEAKRMTLSEIVAMAASHGLTMLDKRRHLLLPIPGMGSLLGKWLIPYDQMTSNSPHLSKYCGDVLLLCGKEK